MKFETTMKNGRKNCPKMNHHGMNKTFYEILMACHRVPSENIYLKLYDFTFCLETAVSADTRFRHREK